MLSVISIQILRSLWCVHRVCISHFISSRRLQRSNSISLQLAILRSFTGYTVGNYKTSSAGLRSVCRSLKDSWFRIFIDRKRLRSYLKEEAPQGLTKMQDGITTQYHSWFDSIASRAAALSLEQPTSYEYFAGATAALIKTSTSCGDTLGTAFRSTTE